MKESEERMKTNLGESTRAVRDSQSRGLGDGVCIPTMRDLHSFRTVGRECGDDSSRVRNSAIRNPSPPSILSQSPSRDRSQDRNRVLHFRNLR